MYRLHNRRRHNSIAVWLRRLVVLAIGIMSIPLAGCVDPVPPDPTVKESDASRHPPGSTTVVNEPTPAQRTDIAPADKLAGENSDQDRVFFDYDKAEIKPEALPIVRHAAAWLKKYPNSQILIEGHADERGTREYNLALGARRASALQAVLLSLDVPKSQIAGTVSYGKERPAVVGSTEVAWAQNRRAVMVVQ